MRGTTTHPRPSLFDGRVPGGSSRRSRCCSGLSSCRTPNHDNVKDACTQNCPDVDYSPVAVEEHSGFIPDQDRGWSPPGVPPPKKWPWRPMASKSCAAKSFVFVENACNSLIFLK